MLKMMRWTMVVVAMAGLAQAEPSFLPIPPSVIKEVQTGKPATPSAAKAQQQRIDLLKEKALGEDPDVSLGAIKDLKAMGAAARPTLISVVRQVLARDLDEIEAALKGIGDSKIAAEYEQQIERLRKEARDNVPKLSKEEPETIKKAHEYYKELQKMTQTMNQAWQLRMTIAQFMNRRPELVRIWRDVASQGERQFSAESESKLRERATRAVGDFMDRVAQLTWGKEPGDASMRTVWFFGMCRKIEAYNNLVAPKCMDTEEFKNLKMVNEYREMIGILPYEVDERLTQAARRHSKEMTDKNYFSHESPTPGLVSFVDRCKAAGYPHPSGENIAVGNGTGEGCFWMWFDSPGHHKNMAGGSSALGVGRWAGRMTQNFGGGARIMLMNDQDREKQKVDGTALAPEGPKVEPGRKSRGG